MSDWDAIWSDSGITSFQSLNTLNGSELEWQGRLGRKKEMEKVCGEENP